MLLTLLSTVIIRKKWLNFYSSTTPTRQGPPHYQDFTITLRHTTLGTMAEITTALTTPNSRSKIPGQLRF
jgi:hypothetical protein